MNEELARFLKELHQDIRTTQLSEDDGGVTEQIFTRIATELLTDAGETENVRVAYDEGQLGTKNQHKINAYGEPDNYETLDLFITIFKDADTLTTIPKEDIDKASKRIANFYRKSRNKNYVGDIEEASEIWEFAQTIASHEQLHENLVRINAIVLTNGLYSGKIPVNERIGDCPVNFRVVDLTYLYNITTKSQAPIEIDFDADGYEVPCIPGSNKYDLYQSYVAIMPGRALMNMYERYGARLLEQNVRSFLQFTGKVNKGIRHTINQEPEMFLAFNNGIAATAESVEITKSDSGLLRIKRVEDFQIVNGGQTTASIYHTAKKDRANIDNIYVQVKLSIIKVKSRYSEIVSRIAEYSNTQNKVAFSELSSNIPFHVEIEKLSRAIVTPYIEGGVAQTKWFYERARGQYKNARLREGFTQARKKKFDLTHPTNQMFTKGDLAKYVNLSAEVTKSKKTVIGPHTVVRGPEKNYVEFVKHRLIDKPDNVYFEDLIAKAIIYKAADRIYGKKPNALGDLKFVTVPYSVAWIHHASAGGINLFKIWKAQAISVEMQDIFKMLMPKLEKYLKALAPGSLYAEFAKRQECWDAIKQEPFIQHLDRILKDDLVDPTAKIFRARLSDSEIGQRQIEEDIARIREVEEAVWKRIADWGRASQELTQQEITAAQYLPAALKRKRTLDEVTRITAVRILNKGIEKAPELFSPVLESKSEEQKVREAAKNLLMWSRKNRVFVKADEEFLAGVTKDSFDTTSEVTAGRVIALLKTAAKKGFGS